MRDPVSNDLAGARRPHRLLAILVAAVLVLAAAAGYVVESGLGPVPVRPSPAAPSPSATAPFPGASARSPAGSAGPATRAPPSAAAPASPSLEAQIAAVEAQVPPLRDLQPTRAVATRIIDPAALHSLLVDRLDAVPAATITTQQDLLVRLGFAKPGLDLRQLSLDALSAGAIGMYETSSRSMTVVDRGLGLVARITVAHEYTHALQDQHFGLQRLGAEDSLPTDRVMAVRALLEGDASLVTQRWMQGNVTTSGLAELGQLLASAGQPVPAGAPAIFARQLLFPYLEGASFATALYQRGGWRAVDAAYTRPPVSTAEILHPDRYLAGWRPTAVRAPALAPVVSAGGWREAIRDTVGELGLQVWLSSVLVPATDRATSGRGRTDGDGAPLAIDPAALASHWTGDQVVSWDGSAGSWAIDWVTAWDSEAAAASFAAAAGAGPNRVHLVTLDGTRVTLSLASDFGALRVASSAR